MLSLQLLPAPSLPLCPPPPSSQVVQKHLEDYLETKRVAFPPPPFLSGGAEAPGGLSGDQEGGLPALLLPVQRRAA